MWVSLIYIYRFDIIEYTNRIIILYTYMWWGYPLKSINRFLHHPSHTFPIPRCSNFCIISFFLLAFSADIHHWRWAKAVDLLPPVLQVLQAWDGGVLHGAIWWDMCKKLCIYIYIFIHIHINTSTNVCMHISETEHVFDVRCNA